MKKKAIEKIPFMGADYTWAKRIEFVARAAVKIIDEEKHLFLEVYKNDRDSLEIPICRIVLSKKEHGWYKPEDGIWRNSYVIEEYGFTTIFGIIDTEQSKNIKITKEELQKIEKFIGRNKYKWEPWIRLIYYAQRDRNTERREQSKEKREDRVREALADTPEISERMKEWAKGALFDSNNFMFYQVKGSKAVLTCSKCGKTGEYRIHTGNETYEESLAGRIDRPRKGIWSKCRFCDAVGTYQNAGKYKHSDMRSGEYCYEIQPFRKDGVVVRYIMAEREIVPGEPEKYTFIDIAMNWYEGGKKRSMKAYTYYGWDYRLSKRHIKYTAFNFGGYNNVVQKKARVYPGSYSVIEGSFLKYCALKEYAFTSFARKVKTASYLDLYLKHPEVEILIKLGLPGIVEEMIEYTRVPILKKGNSIEECLGINKGRLKFLQKAKGSTRVRKLLCMEKETGKCFKEKELTELDNLFEGFHLERVKSCLQYMSLEKMLNKIYRYARVIRDGHEVSRVERERINSTLQLYEDYLEMRKRRNYDMTDTIILFPKNLQEEHQKMVMECNKEELDKRIAEVNEKYGKIADHFEKLNKKYAYEAEGFCIRPAMTAGEIVMEGRILHHCVGGDTYLRKHNYGDSYILFLRSMENPDVAYITVEINAKDNRIMQWHGQHNKKPENEFFDRWLDKYRKHLSERNVKNTQKVQLMAAV